MFSLLYVAAIAQSRINAAGPNEWDVGVGNGARCKLTLCDRLTHIYISNLAIIGSGNGLSPGRHQAVIWTDAGILWTKLIGIKR